MKPFAKLLLPLIGLFIGSSPLLAGGAPVITSASANASVTAINVTGTNFVAQDKNHQLVASLNDTQLTITGSTPTALTANLPANLPPGSYHLFVSSNGNVSDNGHTAELDVTIGTTGPQGATGATGVAGATGATGAVGAAGAPGATGANGSPGANGLNGAPGTAGVAGPIGPMGPAGAKGDPGAPGSTGAQGPAGAQGPTGAPGPAGGGGSASIIPVIAMVWSSSPTPVSHPADGVIGCNNEDPTDMGVTYIWSSYNGADHVNYSSLFNVFSWDVGGYLVIRNVSPGNGSPQNILVFPLSKFGYGGGADFQTINCAPATIWLGSGFSDGDQVLVSFLPPAPDLP